MSEDNADQQAEYNEAVVAYQATFLEQRLRIVDDVLELIEVSGPVSEVTGMVIPLEIRVLVRYKLEKLPCP